MIKRTAFKKPESVIPNLLAVNVKKIIGTWVIELFCLNLSQSGHPEFDDFLISLINGIFSPTKIVN